MTTAAEELVRASGAAVWRRRLAYGVGSVGTGVFTSAPSVLLLYFLTVEVRIDAAVAGLIMLGPKALGLIGDPLVGAWSDRLRRGPPNGRLMLMGVGAALTGLGFWALFRAPQASPGVVWVPALIYLVCTTGYSLFAVPYSSLPAELAPGPGERGALVATRLAISFVGGLIGAVTAPILAGRAGYPVMGLVLGAVCLTAMATFIATCRLPAVPPARPRPAHLDADLPPKRTIDAAFARRAGAFVLLLAAAGAFTSLLPFLVHDMGARADVVGVAMLVNILAALGASAVWPLVLRRGGVGFTWRAVALLMLGAGVTVALAPAPNLQLYLGMVLGGVGFSGLQIAGFTGLADLTAEHLGEGRGGGFVTGLWMAGEKAGLACGPMLAGLGLRYVHLTMAGSTGRMLLGAIPTVLALTAIALIGRSSAKTKR